MKNYFSRLIIVLTPELLGHEGHLLTNSLTHSLTHSLTKEYSNEDNSDTKV
jgi:hypothetical protein